MNRILLVALMLVIGSPDCWCCLLHRESQAKPACCESASADASGCPMRHGGEGSKKNPSGQCPFVQGQRDAAFAAVPVPVPVITWEAPLWITADVFRLESVQLIPRRVEDDGPPQERLPAFVRHHALLL